MAAYYTRAKARSEVEPEDLEQSDVASGTTTTIAASIPVGLQVESTGEFESMATEIAGPVATHPQLPPEGGHPSAGGHGVAGSANSPLVGVSTLGYPSGPADPLDSEMASATDTQSSADLAQSTSTSTISHITSRQPPTANEATTAAFQSPTHMLSVLTTFSGQLKDILFEATTGWFVRFLHRRLWKRRTRQSNQIKPNQICSG